MEQKDIEFWRTAYTALAIIRDSALITRKELAAALDLPPLAVVDILEELEEQQFIRYENPSQIRITVAGLKQVQFITLVRNGEQPNVFRRWTANDPVGRPRLA